MEPGKLELQGGQIQIDLLHSGLKENEYAALKGLTWMHLVTKGLKPVKWLKANKKGTKINFQAIRTREELEKASAELTSYLDATLAEFGGIEHGV